MQYPKGFASRLPHVGTTIFTTMSKMAAAYNAINLSQGFPDFEISPQLIGLVNQYMKKGLNQYAPMAGIMPLREHIAEKVNNSYSCNFHPEDEITITTGATEALFAAITAVVKPGDEVIIFDPAYDSYSPAIVLNGGRPVHIALDDQDFHINWEEVKEQISDKTRLIIINSPHNPSGAILSADDMEALAAITKGTEILILSDEVYEHIIFDGKPHHSILQQHELRQRSAAVFSFGKMFHATGWKTGYCIAPAWWTKELRKIHQYLTFSVNTPVQYALADFIQQATNYTMLGNFYQEKRDLFLRFMKGAAFTPVKSRGTYFQLMSYSNISDISDIEMSEWLTKEKGVATIPISVFYKDGVDNQLLRFCFAKNDETLEKAAAILCGL